MMNKIAKNARKYIPIIEKRLIDKFFRKLSTGTVKKVHKKTANIRTYAQIVDNLCISCDYSIYSSAFYTELCGLNNLKLWTVWKSLLICWYY